MANYRGKGELKDTQKYCNMNDSWSRNEEMKVRERDQEAE